ncbi:MAG: substrate-binding protein [Kiritimatiellae bacterium]|nr:substrate-binding protein [Kiritimatiellia bacterium]
MRKMIVVALVGLVAWLTVAACVQAQDTVKVGLNYPKTGPYASQGLDQIRAAELATEEINAAGGILGKKVEIVARDSQSKVDVTRQNVTEMIDRDGVKMVFGGSASSVAVESGNVCQEKGVLFFGTLTYSNDTTGRDGHRHTFRECYNAWMGAKVLGEYLKRNFPGKKYFYVTADYTWGWTTEASVRKFTGTEDTQVHKGIKTPFPTATEDDFKKAIAFAKIVKADVLVLVEFGTDMEMAIRQATVQGLKGTAQIVVPNLTLGMAEGGGPKVMEDVLGALPWAWNVPIKYNYPKGKEFVQKFSARFGRYPSTSGASAYAILYEYKAAVERAGTFESAAVIKALEGHEYTLLKDKQQWRCFDHQSLQTVYLVRCKKEIDVLKDQFKMDYFDIVTSMSGEESAQTRAEWNAERAEAGKATYLEPLPGETPGDYCEAKAQAPAPQPAKEPQAATP